MPGLGSRSCEMGTSPTLRALPVGGCSKLAWLLSLHQSDRKEAGMGGHSVVHT